MMKPRISLFAEHEREDRRSKIGDPLGGLTKDVDFEALAASIDAAAPRPSRAKGARSPYSTLLVVKILVLQQLYNLADDALEYQLLDRRSFLQFLDITESSSIPDAKTIWLFRDRLAQAGAGSMYSNRFNNSCTSMAIWRAEAKSSMLRWSRRQSSATSAKRPTPSSKAPCR